MKSAAAGLQMASVIHGPARSWAISRKILAKNKDLYAFGEEAAVDDDRLTGCIARGGGYQVERRAG